MEAREQRSYLCIDGKFFFASVECAERGLNPFETNLVVADPGRGKNALCLAISPHLKALGVKNRCRLSDIPGNIKYEIALPRMQLYVDYCADIVTEINRPYRFFRIDDEKIPFEDLYDVQVVG